MRNQVISFSFATLLVLLGCSMHESASAQIFDKVVNKVMSDKKVTDAVSKKVNNVALDQLKKMKDKFSVADLNMAVSFSDNSGMYEKKEFLPQFLKYSAELGSYLIDEKSYTKKDEAQNYTDMGEYAYAFGMYNKAQDYFKQAISTFEAAGLQNTPEYSQVVSDLGLVYHSMGQFNLAEQYSSAALDIRKTNPDDLKGQGTSYNNIGVLYKDEGKYTESEDYLQKSMDMIQKAEGNGNTYAIVMNNLAILYQNTGKYKDAEQLLLKALSLASKDMKEKDANYVRMKINLALLYQLQEKYADAEKIYLEAIEIKKKRLGTKSPDYAVLLQHIADLYQLKKEYAKAESYLNEAIGIFKQKFGDNAPSTAEARYDLARLYQDMGQPAKAAPLLTQAIQAQHDNLGVHHPAYVASLNAQAILYWQEKDYTTAVAKYRDVLNEYLFEIQKYFPAMSEYDKTKFWDKIGPNFFHFNAFVVDAQDKVPGITGDMYNFHIATKAILFSSTSKVKKLILSSGNSQLISQYKQWTDLKEYLAKLYTMSRDDLKQDRINLDSLEYVSNNLEKDLSKQSDLFSKNINQKQVSWQDIASSLNTGEGCVEIIRFRNYNGPMPDTAVYYASLILKKSSKAPELVLFKNGNAMENVLIGQYREAMQGAAKVAYFYDDFWGDIGPKTSDLKLLYASLDGVYNQMSLNTLQKSNGSYLLDEKDIYYITNTNEIPELKRSLAQKSNPFGNKKAVLIGNPHYAKELDLNKVKQSPLPELPGTDLEIMKISGILKNGGWSQEVDRYDQAMEEKVKAVQHPAVLHIATHGFFLADAPDPNGDKVFGIEPEKAAENPLLRSGLMFAGADNTIQQIAVPDSKDKDDGILNAYEAMTLNLEGTELVVLSACETGLGETKNGEGVYGLQRAFRIAGSSALMISLWEVSDAVTQKLMSSFYKNWLQLKDKHKAFLKAQMEIKASNPQPFYWGAFMLVGN